MLNRVNFLLLTGILFLFFGLDINAQEKKKIQYTASTMEYDETLDKDAMRLKDNVICIHEGVTLYCDSAWFYSKKNSVKAFSNIHMIQGDSLHLYGDYLYYDGNLKYAKVRNNVKLTQDSAYMVTDSLDYDRNTNMAFYLNYGKMVDSVNTLESIKGYYYTDIRDFKAIDSVVLHNPDYTMYSDTLLYNTNSKIAKIFGPTEIISDSNYIYGEAGWYNTNRDIAQLEKNTLLKNNKQTLKGDSLYYEKYHKNGKGFGEAFHNVELIDTTEKVILRSNYAYYFEEPERALLVDSAYCIYVMEGDSLYIHADTLRSLYDSTGENKMIKAYYKAKLFKKDFQAMSDSIVYSFQDSVVRMYHKPVLWSEENQITADFIQIFSKNSKIDYAEIKKNALIVSKEDSIHFNQIKGFSMTGYFRDDEIYKIKVEGEGETLYIAKDDDGLIGINKATGSDMVIQLGDGEVTDIRMYKAPKGTMFPVNDIAVSDQRLEGFSWQEEHRPLKWADIFEWKVSKLPSGNITKTSK